MRKTYCCITIFALIASIGVAAAQTNSDAITISGVVDKPGSWGVDQIKSQFSADMKLIDYASHGQKHQSDCVPLLSLLKAAGTDTALKMNPAADPKTKNYPLRLIVLIRGNDGYTVCFSLAELLPDIGNQVVWVALDQDGQPLSAKDGPVRLVVPADVKPGRWVHAVSEIRVIDPTAAATTQPAN
jgi:DMSO/TMAO reductase YedYZ molybdopterin-dependent catalytic subunit